MLKFSHITCYVIFFSLLTAVRNKYNQVAPSNNNLKLSKVNYNFKKVLIYTMFENK